MRILRPTITLYRGADGAEAIVEAGTEMEQRLRDSGFRDDHAVPNDPPEQETPRRRGRPRKTPKE